MSEDGSSSTSPSALDRPVRVGLVRAAFGVEGALKVEPLSDHDSRFASGSRVSVLGEARSVEWSRPAAGGLVVKLSGIDDRTSAELHRGSYLEIPLGEVVPLPEDRFYHHQLVGLEARTASGQSLGRITDVLERPANDVWVAREGRVEHLIPATRDAVVNVDVDGGTVTVADWLLDVDDA